MDIHLTTNDGVPIYRQIVSQIRQSLSLGHLTAGEELPPIRKLAELLLVNPNTVARAYRELELLGLVRCQRGAGTRIVAPASPLSKTEQTRILNERIDALLFEARQFDLDLDGVHELIQNRIEEMNRISEEKVG